MGKEDFKAKKEAKKLRKAEKKAKKEKRKRSNSLTDDGSNKSLEKKRKKKEKKRNKKIKHKDPMDNSNETAKVQGSTSQVNDLTTPFRKKRLQMLISLLPHSLKNIHQNIQKRISTLLLKYNDGVGGVLLTYSNIQYAEHKEGGIGQIWGELPHIHYKVELDALVFEPCVGMQLMGVVNECFPSHVGMLVRSFFNAMIPSQILLNGYEFDSSSQKWKKINNDDNDDDHLKEIGIDDEVPFIVEQIHECAGLISIEGKLLK